MDATDRLAQDHRHVLHGVGCVDGGCSLLSVQTELDHGSNVREIETEARYDPSTECFDIHTPHPGARKAYIGNALHGIYATVFARLILADGSDKGPHAFIVPVWAVC